MSTSAAQNAGLYLAFGDQDAARLFAQLAILNEHRMGRRLLSPIDKHILFLSVPQTMSRWPASAPVLQDPVA
ncbi:hypothetical protein IFR04_002283 [Cadophora malorum]|uniref:Uncharacterized protein n=1 Tax=Cadophora malorum TaxID=108018 RepID=A0A8H7WGN1_9HELO|nr:hypothetical protein IFR04_002283 [Cadophora malorum]